MKRRKIHPIDRRTSHGGRFKFPVDVRHPLSTRVHHGDVQRTRRSVCRAPRIHPVSVDSCTSSLHPARASWHVAGARDGRGHVDGEREARPRGRVGLGAKQQASGRASLPHSCCIPGRHPRPSLSLAPSARVASDRHVAFSSSPHSVVVVDVHDGGCESAPAPPPSSDRMVGLESSRHDHRRCLRRLVS